jgi:potassium/chloride transporter 9
MFSDSPTTPTHPHQSIYARPSPQPAPYTDHPALPTTSSTPLPASGFPSTPSLPLSFNALPCRAQHLILNELMQRHSDVRSTAVLFTTLPAPAQGTGVSEESSVAYLSDLEVLCEGLGPVVLVHSNSLTVTMNL